MRSVIALMVVAAVACTPVTTWAQKDVAPAVEVQAWREMTAAIPPGSRVKVQTRSGRRLTATLMSADAEGVILKKNTRVAEPAIALRYDELASLERIERGEGMGIGKAIGIGLAAGVGAILTMFAIAFTLDD